jgi:ABC-2 type transport system ATP-binding protein
VIEVRELSRRYGPLVAVDRVSFTASQGEIVGLLGPNGAGKTTMMKVLTGYHYPHAGSVRVCGFDVEEEPLAAKRCIGYLPENAPAYGELTVTEYLDFACGAHRMRRDVSAEARERVIELCALDTVVHRPLGELSRGFRQRVGLAQALVHDPDVVILDEPTSGLDPNQILEIRRVIRELGREKTVLLSTHILHEVEMLCDRVLILDSGRIVAGGTAAEISRQTAGRSVVTVTLADPVAADDLSSVAELGEILDSDGATVRIALRAGCSGEIVFDWAVRHAVRIRSLVPERFSLEEVFSRLTTGADQ